MSVRARYKLIANSVMLNLRGVRRLEDAGYPPFHDDPPAAHHRRAVCNRSYPGPHQSTSSSSYQSLWFELTMNIGDKVSVGTENIADIIADFDEALKQVPDA